MSAKPPAVLTCGVTTSLSMMSVVLSGWTPEPGAGSARVAEMTGHEVVMTEPFAVKGVPPGLPQGQAPLWGLQGEEGGPGRRVAGVVLGAHPQVM
jgi:hypothetical protein